MGPDTFLDNYLSNMTSPPVAMTPEERSRHRNEAQVIYKMIERGEIPNPGEETMKRLLDQISGVIREA
jgi:hypothetical protein